MKGGSVITEESKQAAYRRRQNQKLRDLRKTEDLIANRIPFGESETHMGQHHWFEVDIYLDRGENKGTLEYMMQAGQLSRLLEDVKLYNTAPETAPWHGTYAMVARNGNIPGMTSLAFTGLTISGVRNTDNYQTPSCYDISEAAVDLLITKH